MAENYYQNPHYSKGSSKSSNNNSVNYKTIGSWFIIFAIISFITSFIFTMSKGKTHYQTFDDPYVYQSMRGANNVPDQLKQEYIIGPITTTKDKETFSISGVHNGHINRTTSNYIEVELLDQNKEYLYSVGDEVWYEEGYDSDGRWVESNRGIKDAKITIPKAGKYYFRFKTEKQAKINARISRRRGSGVPHFWLGVITIIIGIAMISKHSEQKQRNY